MANGKETALHITVQSDGAIGKYKAGQELKTAAHVGDWLKLQAMAQAESDVARSKIEKATPQQIVAVAATVDVSEIEDLTDKYQAYIQAVLDAPFATDASQVPALDRLRGTSEASTALKYGALVSDRTIKDTDETIAAMLRADAGALYAMVDLERDAKSFPPEGNYSFWDIVPPMGTRNQPGKKNADKPPLGYVNPKQDNPKGLPVYRGPWQHYQQEVTRADGTHDTQDRDWLAEFVSKKIARGLSERVNHLRAAIKGNLLQSGDKVLMDEAKAFIEQAKTDNGPLSAALDEAVYQWQKRLRLYNNAFQLAEGKHAIERKWPNVKVVLYGTTQGEADKEGTPTPAALRRTKPFCLEQEGEPDASGKVRVSTGAPFKASLLKKASEIIRALPDNATAAAVITYKKPKKGDKGTAEVTHKEGTPKIESVAGFLTVITALNHYVMGDKTDLLRNRTKDVDAGPAFCAEVCNLYDLLDEVVRMEGVREKAQAYTASVSAAQGELAEAKSKAKKAA